MMKKLTAALAAVFLVGAGAALAASYTNQLGQVFTITESHGVIAVASTPLPGYTSVAGPTLYGGSPGFRLDTNATVDVTTYTPRGYGDMIIGTTTQKVWIATGLTANDWVILN